MTGDGGARRCTLAAPGRADVTVRQSRFFAVARPLPDDAEALRAWLAEVRGAFPDARHIVFAWRGADGSTRGSDAGEPHGTGFRPCLDALAGAGAVDAAVAVARIFGGQLLGVGRLARAYGTAAAGAVAQAGVRAVRAHHAFSLTVPIAAAHAVLRALEAHGAVRTTRTSGGDGVLSVRGEIPAEAVTPLGAALADASAGAARLEVAPECRWR